MPTSLRLGSIVPEDFYGIADRRRSVREGCSRRPFIWRIIRLNYFFAFSFNIVCVAFHGNNMILYNTIMGGRVYYNNNNNNIVRARSRLIPTAAYRAHQRFARIARKYKRVLRSRLTVKHARPVLMMYRAGYPYPCDRANSTKETSAQSVCYIICYNMRAYIIKCDCHTAHMAR